jgi:hypothetical protein
VPSQFDHIIKKKNQWSEFDSKEILYQLHNLAERRERLKVWKEEKTQKKNQKLESKDTIGISLRGTKAEKVIQKSGQQVIPC